MKRSTLAAVLASAFAGATLVPVAAPAPEAVAGECTAYVICGTIKHYSPDDGYNPAIIIRCTYGDDSTKNYVAEGESSKKYCQDNDQVYVRAGEEIWCKYLVSDGMPHAYKWVKKFDAAGWHKTNDLWDDGLGCTLRKD